MASNNIELNIGSKFDGEGFNKLNTALRSSSGNVSRVSGAVGNMLTNMDGLDGSIGKVIRSAGGLIGGLLSMGVWGVAIGAVTKFIGWMESMRNQAKEARLAAKGLSKEFMTLDAMARGYQRRVEQWKQKKRESDEADAKAAKAAERARQAEFEAMDKRMQMEKEYDQYLMKTAALKEKIAGLSDEQIAVNSARRQVEFANKWEGTFGQTEAQLNLELAQKAATAKFNQLADEITAELDAADAEAEAAQKAAAAKKKSAEAEEKRAKIKDESEKKLKELDDRIAAAKENAAQLEENAARARGGKTFGEWQRGERELEREQKKEAQRQQRVIDNAQRERDAIGGRIFDVNGRLKKSASKADIARFKKLGEFLADQDPNNNPALKEAERLEQEKADLIAKVQRDIADIAAAITNNT